MEPNISKIFTHIPNDDEILFLKQLDIRYVHVWVLEDELHMNQISNLKNRLSKNGITLWMLGCKELCKNEKIILNLPGREIEIRKFKKMLQIMGDLNIPTTVFTWEPSGVWSSGVTETRGAQTRFVDAKEMERRPFTHGREYVYEELEKNFHYFLDQISKTALDCGVTLALHPNDPPLDAIGGISCLVNSKNNYDKFFSTYNSEILGMEFCCGCWLEGGDKFGNLLSSLKEYILDDRVKIVHFRNVSSTLPRFTETFLDNGYMDMNEIIKILIDIDYSGTLTMDHTPKLVDFAGAELGGEAYAIGYMRGLSKRQKTL